MTGETLHAPPWGSVKFLYHKKCENKKSLAMGIQLLELGRVMEKINVEGEL
jgi:hypothetical protein